MNLVDLDTYDKLGLSMPHEEFEEFLEGFMKRCVEETLRAIPSAINHLVNSATTMKSLSENFYKENPELLDHKNLVTKVMEGVEGKHPELGLKALLEKTGMEAKRTLTTTKEFDVNPSKRPNIVEMDSGFGEL